MPFFYCSIGGSESRELLFFFELAFRGAAYRTDPIFRDVFECGAWAYPVFGITLLGVVDIAADYASVLSHVPPLQISTGASGTNGRIWRLSISLIASMSHGV